MRTDRSEQYGMTVVIIEEGDLPMDFGEFLEFVDEVDASRVFPEEDNDLCICVRFPNGPDELYTVEAIRPSIVGVVA